MEHMHRGPARHKRRGALGAGSRSDARWFRGPRRLRRARLVHPRTRMPRRAAFAHLIDCSTLGPTSAPVVRLKANALRRGAQRSRQKVPSNPHSYRRNPTTRSPFCIRRSCIATRSYPTRHSDCPPRRCLAHVPALESVRRGVRSSGPARPYECCPSLIASPQTCRSPYV